MGDQVFGDCAPRANNRQNNLQDNLQDNRQHNRHHNRHAEKAPPRVNAARCAAVAALVVAIGGCGHDTIQSLPESAFVEDAPWPRLVDNPAAFSLEGDNSVESEVAEGDAIKSELGPEAEALIARDAELRTRDVVDPGLYARADRLRSRAARLRARAE